MSRNASKRVSMANGPSLRHAAKGIPSGPGAELLECSTALRKCRFLNLPSSSGKGASSASHRCARSSSNQILSLAKSIPFARKILLQCSFSKLAILTVSVRISPLLFRMAFTEPTRPGARRESSLVHFCFLYCTRLLFPSIMSA